MASSWHKLAAALALFTGISVNATEPSSVRSTHRVPICRHYIGQRLLGQTPEITVSGGGTAGLAFARKLQLNGVDDFRIFDPRTARELPGGYGFIILENGINALHRLEIYDEAVARGNLIGRYVNLSPSGEILNTVVLEAPVLGLKRADLQSLLVKDMPSERLHFGASVETVIHEPSSSPKNPPFLVVAEGIGSPGRAKLAPKVLRDAGYFEIVGISDAAALATAWRGTFRRYEDLPHRQVFGVFPAGDGQLVWYFRKALKDLAAGKDPRTPRLSVGSGKNFRMGFRGLDGCRCERLETRANLDPNRTHKTTQSAGGTKRIPHRRRRSPVSDLYQPRSQLCVRRRRGPR